jgi:phenylacetate-CoA ligase
MNNDRKNILFIGPLPPPVGGVSIHIKRLTSLLRDDYNIDFVDESYLKKEEYFNLRTLRILPYLKKVRNADLLYIHSGKRQLVIFHVLISKLFRKRIILTMHGYPWVKKTLLTLIDSLFYSMADRIILVNSFILERVRLPERKCIVKWAFVPPVIEDEPVLPDEITQWIENRKKLGEIIISANAYQLRYFDSQDLYGLDMCIEAAGRLVKKGYPVSFIYIVSSLEKNKDLFEKYLEQITESDFKDHFLLLNEAISFVRLITCSDIILRPTNTDGDALTVREAIHLGKPVIASDVIPRPAETILFKNRDHDDLEKQLIRTIEINLKNQNMSTVPDLTKDYKMFYSGLVESVINSSRFTLSGIKDKSKMLSEKIPPTAGRVLNHIPFSIRLGNEYQHYFDLADRMLIAGSDTRTEYILSNFDRIFGHFRMNSPFYNNYLDSKGCLLDRITSLNDIRSVPIITKSSLRESPVERRTVLKHGYKQFNTGGTSGSPLSFFLENNFYAREWSHMHYMWRKIGYKPTSTKITIRGKNLDGIYKYRFNQNEFLINSYYSYTRADFYELLNVFKRYNTEYIHGYPSAIFNFLKEVSANAPFLLSFLQKNIKGIMFGSEFPSPHFRDYIEGLLTRNTISWYGHTEGVIMAGELYQKYVYVPFLSYGYTEAVIKDDQFHLVGTSFDNYAAPFIRYDTEDIINPTFNTSGLLESFEITEGRLGEFVIDKNDKKISLTALIFGRHHKLFDTVNFIQVRQLEPGRIKVYYSNNYLIENPSDLFDSTNLNIEVLFEQVKEPFKTPFGKIPLLIK